MPTVRLLERTRGHLASWDAALAALGLSIIGRNLPAGDTLGRRLATLRQRRGLSQRALAALAGVTPATISALERSGIGRLETLDRVLGRLGAGAQLSPAGAATTILTGCALSLLATLPDQSAHACVTSPPYFRQRDYLPGGHPDKPLEIGNEPTPEDYTARLVRVFREVKRVLRDDGSLWLNLGDTRRGSQLLGIPWRVAFALQDDGWLLRCECIWHRPNGMPESVKDRPTDTDKESVFLFSKTPAYYFDHRAIKEPLAEGSDVAYRQQLRRGKTYASKEPYRKNMPASFDLEAKNRRSVWSINTKPGGCGHVAPYPPELVEICVLASSPPLGVILDPFLGSATTALVAERLGRHCIGIELDAHAVDEARRRLAGDTELLDDRWRPAADFPLPPPKEALHSPPRTPAP